MNLWPDGLLAEYSIDEIRGITDIYQYAHILCGPSSVKHTEDTLNNYYHKLMRIEL